MRVPTRAAEHGGRVEVSKGVAARDRQVVGRHVDSLHRCNRTFAGGGDTLLQFTHFVARLAGNHGRGHTASSVDTRSCLVKRKMLSMNSSVSEPSTSRKYSATVSALRATRRRLQAALSSAVDQSAFGVGEVARLMTPDSVISSQNRCPRGALATPQIPSSRVFLATL